MNTDILNKYIKNGYISISKYFLSNYKKLNITSDEFIILIYLMNFENKIIYNPKIIGNAIDMNEKEVLTIINKLKEKCILNIVVEKNSNNIIEEYISLDLLYQKIVSLIFNIKKDDDSLNIFEVFEKEFGRTLSPMEYEIINAWLETDFNKDMILEALKEATYNGVNNLRYIDKIIFEWKKKGFKTIEEIRKYNKNFKKVKPEKKELFDYNWLEDEE